MQAEGEGDLVVSFGQQRRGVRPTSSNATKTVQHLVLLIGHQPLERSRHRLLDLDQERVTPVECRRSGLHVVDHGDRHRSRFGADVGCGGPFGDGVLGADVDVRGCGRTRLLQHHDVREFAIDVAVAAGQVDAAHSVLALVLILILFLILEVEVVGVIEGGVRVDLALTLSPDAFEQVVHGGARTGLLVTRQFDRATLVSGIAGGRLSAATSINVNIAGDVLVRCTLIA